MEKSVSEEFEFIRSKLEKIARLLTQMDPNSIVEASFMIGCLHNVCHENSLKYKEDV